MQSQRILLYSRVFRLFLLVMKKPKFSADGYLKTTKMGRDGEKITSFEFAASEALEVARLELMSRDQASASKEPVLLRVTAEVVYGKKKKKKGKEIISRKTL